MLQGQSSFELLWVPQCQPSRVPTLLQYWISTESVLRSVLIQYWISLIQYWIITDVHQTDLRLIHYWLFFSHGNAWECLGMLGISWGCLGLLGLPIPSTPTPSLISANDEKEEENKQIPTHTPNPTKTYNLKTSQTSASAVPASWSLLEDEAFVSDKDLFKEMITASRTDPGFKTGTQWQWS